MPKLISESIAGVRIVTETLSSTNPDRPSVLVRCFAGDRSSMGSGDAEFVASAIERRDLARQYRMDHRLRQYRALPIWDLISEREQERFQRSGRYWRKRVPPEPAQDAPEYRIEFVYEPTGDEKSLFGCTARRWMTTQRTVRQAPQQGGESVSDAWYLDPEELAERFPGFSAQLVHRAVAIARSGDERVVFDHQGEKPRGLCAESFTRSFSHSALSKTVKELPTQQMRVTSITTESFPLSLFEPPRNYREVPVYPTRTSTFLERVRGLFSRKRSTPAGYTA